MSVLDSVIDCEFLRAIPKPLLPRLEQLSQTQMFPAGTTLFLEGHHNPEFHIVVTGHVRLEMLVPRRGRIPILTVGPGEILAWSALVANAEMTCTAITLEPVRTVAFDGSRLRELCETEHEIGYHVMRQLASELSKRLVATRLQLLDLFRELQPSTESVPPLGVSRADSLDAS